MKIYILIDPITDAIRYVGVTKNDLQLRLTQHINHFEKTHKGYWIKSLKDKSLKPSIEEIDDVHDDEWQFWEQYWICQFKAWGCRLTNGDGGGLGRQRFTEELKSKIANTLRGRELPHMWTKVLQYDLFGNFVKEFESVKAAAIDIGVSHQSQISTAITKFEKCHGYFWTKRDGEIKQKIDVPYVNGKRVISEETKKKLSITSSRPRTKKYTYTPETLKKMREMRLGKSPANKGQKATPEQLEMMKRCCKTKKRILNIDANGNVLKIWDSIKDASKETGISRCSIGRVCNGIQEIATGLRFVYEDEKLKTEIRRCRCGNPLTTITTQICRSCYFQRNIDPFGDLDWKEF